MLQIPCPECFSKIASGIESCVVAVAIICGGWWTYYTFNTQLQVENARAQLEKLKRELVKEPRIETIIDVEAVRAAKSNVRYLTGMVHFRNQGTADTRLKVSDDSISIAKVEMDDRGVPKFVSVAKTTLYWEPEDNISGIMVLTGTESTGAFASKVDSPGLYFVSFSAPKSPSEVSRAKDLGADTEAPFVWGYSKFLYVQ